MRTTRKIFLLTIFSCFLFFPVGAFSADGPAAFVYTASRSSSFKIFQMNLESGELTFIKDQAADGDAFSFAVSPDKTVLYVGLRGGAMEGVSSFSIDQTDGTLTPINTVALPTGPLAVSVDATGGYILTVPYGTPEATVNTIAGDGSIQEPSTVFQTDEKPHHFLTDPTNKFAYMPCLGADNVHIYQFDEQTGITNPESPAKVSTADGAGPRFMAFHSTKSFFYLGLELNNTIAAYSINQQTGMLTEINTLSTLPEGYTTGKTAQVHITPDNRFIYISNRGHNSLASFAVNQETGALTSAGIYPSEPTPRAFAIGPYGKFLYAGSYETGDIAVYTIHETTGALTEVSSVNAGDLVSGILPVLLAPEVPVLKDNRRGNYSYEIRIQGAEVNISIPSEGNHRITAIKTDGHVLYQGIANFKGNHVFALQSDPGIVIIKVSNGREEFVKKLVRF